MEDDKEGDGSTDSVNSLAYRAELALCISEKAECVACGLEAQFKKVNDASEQAVHRNNERTYFCSSM